MQPNPIKETIAFFATAIGIPGGILAAWKAIEEMKYGRQKKEKETKAKDRTTANPLDFAVFIRFLDTHGYTKAKKFLLRAVHYPP